MTYRTRGRSLIEVLVAVTFVCFLMGFVVVLCIGNYYRAKRAMERQRQRRVARLSHSGNGFVGIIESPKSTNSVASSTQSVEQKSLLGGFNPVSRRQNRDNGVDLLLHPIDTSENIRSWCRILSGIILWCVEFMNNNASYLNLWWFGLLTMRLDWLIWLILCIHKLKSVRSKMYHSIHKPRRHHKIVGFFQLSNLYRANTSNDHRAEILWIFSILCEWESCYYYKPARETTVGVVTICLYIYICYFSRRKNDQDSTNGVVIMSLYICILVSYKKAW